MYDAGTPKCSEKKTFWCPDLVNKFKTSVCCDSHWLAKGANLDTGDECRIDLVEMEQQCEIRTCYKSSESTIPGQWNTDGCTYSPDYLLSYESCVMHDLCYVTPGTTKKRCDEVMEENINKIYCENVNYKDSYACSVRSRVGEFAHKIMSFTDYYYVASEPFRNSCKSEVKKTLLFNPTKIVFYFDFCN
ncbi:uncharacterized protein LOC111704138 [Eurytemora carolleeae]|uniref:uncharacterized protein LOC111704138 n=1 Tax=Eurytemora carolleeae TaxID=1294199 RepID=UPI000C793566|nr:uncharacterized protein LOC111704138 [Eurytemora carolleeae]|eukprot:XP_023332046.1 uncharacterized protein LOC111704138 [Eurytemora affinis]